MQIGAITALQQLYRNSTKALRENSQSGQVYLIIKQLWSCWYYAGGNAWDKCYWDKFWNIQNDITKLNYTTPFPNNSRIGKKLIWILKWNRGSSSRVFITVMKRSSPDLTEDKYNTTTIYILHLANLRAFKYQSFSQKLRNLKFIPCVSSWFDLTICRKNIILNNTNINSIHSKFNHENQRVSEKASSLV